MLKFPVISPAQEVKITKEIEEATLSQRIKDLLKMPSGLFALGKGLITLASIKNAEDERWTYFVLEQLLSPLGRRALRENLLTFEMVYASSGTQQIKFVLVELIDFKNIQNLSVADRIKLEKNIKQALAPTESCLVSTSQYKQ